jgi:hypothetical protein
MIDGAPKIVRLAVDLHEESSGPGELHLCLPFIPSAPATEANRNNRPHAYGRLSPTTIGRESEDFCGGQS